MSLHQMKINGNSNKMIIITWQESACCTVVCLILRLFEVIILENAQTQLLSSFCFLLGTCLGENLKCFWLFRFSFTLIGWIKDWNIIENQIPMSRPCLTCAPKLIIRNGRNWTLETLLIHKFAFLQHQK